MIDPELFGKQMGSIVRESILPITKRLDALEARAPIPGEKGLDGRDGVDGKDGADGKDGVPGANGEKGADGKDGRDVDLAVVADMVRAQVALIPAPADGKSVTIADVEPMIAERIDIAVKAIPEPLNGKDADPADIEIAVRKAIDALPKPKDGEKGQDGKDGKDADPILLEDVARELLSMPELKQLVALLVLEGVSEYIKANPIRDGRDGRDGKDGAKGDPGERGVAGEKGIDGQDGAGIADLLIDRDNALVATMTDGRMKYLGVVVGRDGKDGRDGVSVESLDRIYDSATHEIVERWTGAGQTKELRYPAGGIRHGGYWREGTKAVAGETWTHTGIAWIAKRATDEKPAHNAADWEIFASKGRDGQDAKDAGPHKPVKIAT